MYVVLSTYLGSMKERFFGMGGQRTREVLHGDIRYDLLVLCLPPKIELQNIL